MNITVKLNGESKTWQISPSDTLLHILRREGYFGVKFGGCQKGECGACTVLLDGQPVNSCSLLAAQVDGHILQTIEKVGEHPRQGWKKTDGLHIIQQAFLQSGAIQCGYCTPAMVMAALALLERNATPTEAEARDALSGILCRCTGYVKPVEAILRAAAILRGEEALPEEPIPAEAWPEPIAPDSGTRDRDNFSDTRTRVLPRLWTVPQTRQYSRVGRPEVKVDGLKLVQGKPAFTADIEPRNMLIAKVLWSPVAHAHIRKIDASKARALPGVAAVLTWQDIPRVAYSTAGQSDPIPGPLDTF